MEIILDYIFTYKETFIKDNSDKIKFLDRLIKKFKTQNSEKKGVRIILIEKPYRIMIDPKTGKISNNSLNVFTSYHINGILLFYSLLGSIGFLTDGYKGSLSLFNLCSILTGDQKNANELIETLSKNIDMIPPTFLAEYLFYIHDLLLINRINYKGVFYDQTKKRYKKEYQLNDELIINFINTLSQKKINTKLLICSSNSSFYQENEKNLTSLSKVFAGSIISPIAIPNNESLYYETYLNLNSLVINQKNNKIYFNDFLLYD